MPPTIDRKISTSAWPTALRWAALAFAISALVGWLAIGACMRQHCVSGMPALVGKLTTGYFWLSAPWYLVFSWGAPRHVSSSFTSAFVAIGAGATLALIVFVGRLWFVRFRAFLASPVPEAVLAVEPPPAPVSMLVGLGLILLIFFTTVMSKHGLSIPTFLRATGFAASMLALVLIPFYFEIRRSRKPDKLEICFAFLWIAIRRIALGLAALLFALFAVASYRRGATMTSTFALLFAGVVGWWGWFGAGYRRSFADDRPTHEARKRRYGW